MTRFTRAELSLMRHFAALRLTLKFARLDHAMRKAGYDPNQPRAPAGTPIGGQWVAAGNVQTAPERIRLAGDINGFTKHDINRIVERGISPEAILDAIANPLSIRPRSNGSVQYIGGGATVVLNPMGFVITAWPR